MGDRGLRTGPFILAIAVAALLVLSAPFVGQIRSEIRRAFPGGFVTIIGGLIALGLAGALGAAALRIRDQKLARYSAILLAVGIAVAYSAYRAGPNPESNAVERFHFLQYGLITFLFYRAWRPLGDLSVLLLPIFAGLIVGTVEEWFQWFIPNRVGEASDVFLNLVAICTGLLFSVGVDPPAGMRLGFGPASRPLVLRQAAAAVFVFAVFVDQVHLGFEVHDAEVGVFTSRYTGAELLELQSERAARWAVDPPPTTVARLSREDQYLTEGIQHVRWRNLKWSEGDIAAAWLENRILEKYFQPVLDTPTHEGPNGHRWPPEQRADAEQRVAGGSSSSTYVSGAYPYRILTWGRSAYWFVVGSIVLALLVARSLMPAGAAPPEPRQSRWTRT